MRHSKFSGGFSKHDRAPAVMATVWFGLAVFGLGLLAVYAQRAGDVGRPPMLSAISLPTHESDTPFQLFIAIHPKCPCTAATIGQIERILADSPGRLGCTVLAYEPSGEAGEWSDTSTIAAARDKLGAEILADPDGAIAARFGMRVSGSVVLYGPDGTVRFFGGLTSARAHEGDSVGKDAVTAVLRGNEPLYTTAPVYGCRIGVEDEYARE